MSGVQNSDFPMAFPVERQSTAVQLTPEMLRADCRLPWVPTWVGTDRS